MSSSRPLPDVAVLEKLLLGQLPPAETEALWSEFQDSERLAELVCTLSPSDTLIEVLRSQADWPVPRPDARLEGLMARLRQLRPDLAKAGRDPTEAPSAAFVSGMGDPQASRTEPGVDFLAPAQGADEIGRLGQYRVLKLLGVGGMGMVFLAEDTLLGRKVALKTMLPAVAANPVSRERFFREAKAAAAIEHPHIVPIFQVGEDRGVPFLAMPFLKGQSLEARLEREGKLPVAEAVRIAAEMAEGLAAAHEQGLIHRDIKPGNVWLENVDRRSAADCPPNPPRSGGLHYQVKLLDFGLARSQGDDTNLTQSGTIVGTPAFMAPEQARSEKIDARADLFSLGCVLYVMLTGQRPFTGPTTMSILAALALDTPPAPQILNFEVPAPLSDLTMRLLAKGPDERPASANEVAAELRRLPAGRGSDTALLPSADVPRPGKRQRPAPAPRPHRRVGLLVAVLVAVLGLAAAIALGVFKLGTANGELVLQADDEAIEVTIKQPGKQPVVVVVDKNTRKTVELTAVDGEIEARELPDGLRFRTGKLTLTRGKQTVFTAEMLLAERKAPEKPGPAPVEDTPLYPGAFVTRPARLTGVRSWTIASRSFPDFWGPYGWQETSNWNRLAASPDEQFLATSDPHGPVCVYRLPSGELFRILGGSTWAVRGLAWSPDGKMLAACGDDPTVLLWDVASGKRLPAPTLPSFAYAVAWSPDAKVLAFPCGDNSVRLWERETNLMLSPLNDASRAHHGLLGLAWSPNGEKLAVAGSNQEGAIWSISPPRKLVSLDMGYGVTGMAWSPDGKLIATAASASTRSGSVSIYDASSGKLLQKIEKTGGFVRWLDKDRILTVRFLPDPAYPVDLPDGKLAVIEARSGKLLGRIRDGLRLPPRPSLAFSVSPVTPYMETRYDRLSFYRIDTEQPIDAEKQLLREKRLFTPAFQPHFDRFAWSPEGKSLATGSTTGQRVSLWDLPTGAVRDQDVGTPVASFTWSSDSKRLGIAPVLGEYGIRIWDVGGTGELQTKARGGTPIFASPDLTLFASARVSVLEVETGKTRYSWEMPGNQGSFRAFSPDGKILAADYSGPAADSKWGVILYDLTSGKEIANIEGPQGPFTWSPNGGHLVCWAAYGPFGFGKIVDVPKREVMKRKLESEPGNASGASWSPDGKLLAMTCWDNTQVRLWDFETGKLLPQVKGMRGFQVAFAPDGKTLAVHRNVHVMLWDWRGGTYRGTLLPVGKGGVAISPDGHYRATPEAEKTLVYVVETDKGQELLSPEEFAAKYGWKNDPDKVRLTPAP
jgi:serine/threonine protein kinase/WD40 repeat protein